MKRILVTGGNGFIGSELVAKLDGEFSVRASVRAASKLGNSSLPDSIERVVTGDISELTDWDEALQGIDVVIHLAARAHVLSDPSTDPLDVFREVNLKAALRLFRESARHGISRFVFVSSIGVNGNITHGVPFDEQQIPAPISDYAVSKYEAEQQLIIEAEKLGIELVIVRPALVYGKQAPGNFARLTKLATKLPLLPFGLVNNRKSFISVNNLVSLLKLCVHHPAAAGEVFLAADTEVISTKQLVSVLAKVADHKIIQLPIPIALMKAIANLLGKGAMASQLLDDLEIDNSKAKHLLGWNPIDDLESTLN